MNNKIYYFDVASSTKPYPEIIDLNNKLLEKYYANSEAIHSLGIEISKLYEKARQKVADFFGVKNSEIIFTSGASEANNLAIKGFCFNHLKNKGHLITTSYEHPSVLNTFKQMEELFGFEVDYLKPNQDGVIELEELKKYLRKDTLLVSVMQVNNEIGSYNDLKIISNYIKKHSSAYFHSDITQAVNKIEVNLDDVDMASFSFHKFGGLKGSGCLIKKNRVNLVPLINGGLQENGLRAGTVNYIAHICGAKALTLNNNRHNNSNMEYLKNLLFQAGIEVVSQKHIDNIILIKTPIKSEVMQNALSKYNIYVGSKSTCSNKNKDNSNTGKVMNYDASYCIRISFIETNKEDIEFLVNKIKEVIDNYGIKL